MAAAAVRGPRRRCRGARDPPLEFTDDAPRSGAAFPALLASRPAWARQLLDAVDAGKVDPASVPGETVQRLLRSRDDTTTALLKKHFGDVRPATTAELQAEIERLATRVRSGPGDPRAGERLFKGKCASCHTLYGKGGTVGPDLTTYRRDDLDTILLNIVNLKPLQILQGYGSKSSPPLLHGRALSGVLIDQDPQVVVLRSSEGRDVIVPRDQLEEMKPSPTSIMPEGLLKGLSDNETRDLFAYLRSTQPPEVE